MIVKNEEETLPLVLSDVREFADEIVVVDTGSDDRTREIAKDFTDRVFDFPWTDDFSAARNFSLDQATSDYLMWLDADDRVPNQSRKLLKNLIASLSDEDVVMLPYETAFDSGGATFRYFRERIFKNDKRFRFTDPVHEVVVPKGNVVFREIPIEHRKKKPTPSDRNLKIYQKLAESGAPFNARQKYYYANELLRNGFLEQAKAFYEDFLNTSGGMTENRTSARLTLSRLVSDNPRRAAEILLQGFYETPPDAETLVELGHIFVREERYREAIPYYFAALDASVSDYAFRNKDMERYIPSLQLALCYYKLGDKENAVRWNTAAIEAKPDGALARENQKFYLAMEQKPE